MDRAEAIKYLEDCRSQAIHDGVITIGRWRTDVFDMAIAALREQEQSNANQRNSNASNALEWISVRERLPEGGEMVLCKTMYFYEVLQWDERSGVWVGESRICGTPYVTHWMPLPEPPKEGAEG